MRSFFPPVFKPVFVDQPAEVVRDEVKRAPCNVKGVEISTLNLGGVLFLAPPTTTLLQLPFFSPLFVSR